MLDTQYNCTLVIVSGEIEVTRLITESGIARALGYKWHIANTLYLRDLIDFHCFIVLDACIVCTMVVIVTMHTCISNIRISIQMQDHFVLSKELVSWPDYYKTQDGRLNTERVNSLIDLPLLVANCLFLSHLPNLGGPLVKHMQQKSTLSGKKKGTHVTGLQAFKV